MDKASLNELTKLIAAWALLGAVAATILMWVLARLGSGQVPQRKVVVLLLVLAVLLGGGALPGLLQLNPKVTADKVLWPVRVQLGEAQRQKAGLQKENLNLSIAYERATGRKIYVTKGRKFPERIARLNKQIKAAGRERVAAIYDTAATMQGRFGFPFLPSGADAAAKAKFVSDQINALDATTRKEDFEPLGLWEGLFADVSPKEPKATPAPQN